MRQADCSREGKDERGKQMDAGKRRTREASRLRRGREGEERETDRGREGKEKRGKQMAAGGREGNEETARQERGGGEEACDKMKRKLCEEVTRHPKDECMLTQPLSQHTLSTLTTSLNAISKFR